MINNKNTMMKLLLISNSASPGEKYLEKPGADIAHHLEGATERVLFIPFAAVTYSFDEYVSKVNTALAPYSISVKGINSYQDPIKAIMEATAIVVGGGNTFQLLKMIQEQGLLHPIRERVRAGIPYIGWSAGSNIAAPTLCTTNDMPIVDPLSFEALSFVPFQINPHYLDSHPADHGGETREQRILEYIEANPEKYVIGLREGCRLFLENGTLRMVGSKPARIFRKGCEIQELTSEADFNFLLS